MLNNPFEHFSGCFSNKCLTVLWVHMFYFIKKKTTFSFCHSQWLFKKMHHVTTITRTTCQKHWCCRFSPWPSLLCMKPVTLVFYWNLHYTVTKYCDVGYDHLHAVWGLKYCFWVYCWLKVSRDSHVSGVEPMRAETLFQQQSSLHNSTDKGIQTGLLRKKAKK